VKLTIHNRVLTAGASAFCRFDNGYSLLARIFHQAASDTDKTLVIKRETEIIKNTECYSRAPITVQAGLLVRTLALHSNRSYGYAFRSRAALTNANPAPAPVILVRNAG
jgi:hypothetical protein